MIAAPAATTPGQQHFLVNEHIPRTEGHVLAAQIITFPSKWDENTSLLPGTKAGHYHLVSNILLETIKQFFCYRVMSYGFLETAALKETLLG